jgi:hypothetical protein
MVPTFLITGVLHEVVLEDTHEDGSQEAGKQQHCDAWVDYAEPVNLHAHAYQRLVSICIIQLIQDDNIMQSKQIRSKTASSSHETYHQHPFEQQNNIVKWKGEPQPQNAISTSQARE